MTATSRRRHLLPGKHVVTGAPIRQTILVTGFGAFPGARRNPTLAILAGLEQRRARLARLGIDVRCAALPVVYDAVEPALRAAIGDARPDAILHLGLAGGRRRIAVETRALNRASPLRFDAARRLSGPVLAPSAPHVLRATFPAARVRVALAREGHAVCLSIDAGDYVCNATLYRSLLARAAPVVGFIHVPRTRERKPIASLRRRRPSIESLVDAAMIAVLAISRGARALRPATAGEAA